MNARFLKIAAFALLVAASAGPARAGFLDNLYTAGHSDIAVGYENGSLNLFYEMSSTAVVNGSPVGGAGSSLNPGDVTVVVPQSVLTTGGATLPAPFAGNPLYVLLQTSAGAATRPFLGFGAEEIEGGVFANDTLTLALTGFSTTAVGGQFILYTTGAGSTPSMNTADGLSSADFINLFAGGHDHYNLGFAGAGIYDLTFTASGTLAGSTSAISTTATYRFQVGPLAAGPAVPEPASLALAGIAVSAAGLAALRGRKSR